MSSSSAAGDTGSDCWAPPTATAPKSVTQFEVMPMPPEQENKPWSGLLADQAAYLVQPTTKAWCASSPSPPKRIRRRKGKVKSPTTVQVEFKDGKLSEVPRHGKGLACGSGAAGHGLCEPRRHRAQKPLASTRMRGGNAKGQHRFHRRLCHQRVQGVRCRRHPPWPVAGHYWAIREGRQAARAVDEFLMGASELPR